MRQWRVGTLTMGLVLVLSGIGLLYAQFDQAGVVGSIINGGQLSSFFWGLRCWFRIIGKKMRAVGCYDIMSIIIVFFIVMTGLGLHTISELGLGRYS